MIKLVKKRVLGSSKVPKFDAYPPLTICETEDFFIMLKNSGFIIQDVEDEAPRKSTPKVEVKKEEPKEVIKEEPVVKEEKQEVVVEEKIEVKEEVSKVVEKETKPTRLTGIRKNNNTKKK